MVKHAVVTGVAAGFALVCVLAWITWYQARGDQMMNGTWLVVLMIGLPIGIPFGAALGLVGGLARGAGAPRWLAAGAAGAAFVGVVLIFGLNVRSATAFAAPIAGLSWHALLFVDRRHSRAVGPGDPA